MSRPEVEEEGGRGNERMKLRVKVYNKSVHLLCSGQFKKWINMKIKDLLQPSQAFYQRKIQPSQ
jgi:hypothetical protein